MKTFLAQLKHGVFNLIEQDLISMMAAECGSWSDMEMVVLRGFLEPTANVVEVGSNQGLHAVPLAKMVPAGKLIGFEPQRLIFQQLNCNLSLNNITNAYVYRRGVGAENGSMLIDDSHMDHTEQMNYGAFSLQEGYNYEQDFPYERWKTEVPIVALDSFAPVQDLERLDVLKIDVEGAEVGVLQGANATIMRHRPVIFMETNAPHFDEQLQVMRSMDYQVYWCLAWRMEGTGLPQERIEAASVDTNLLCLPKELLQPNANTHHSAKLRNYTWWWAEQFDGLKAHSFDQLSNGEVQLLHMLA